MIIQCQTVTIPLQLFLPGLLIGLAVQGVYSLHVTQKKKIRPIRRKSIIQHYEFLIPFYSSRRSRLSSTIGCFSPKVVFLRRSSSNKGHLPQKVVFLPKSSSTKGHLPLTVVFHQRSSSTKGHLPPKVVFHRRSSSSKGRPPQKVVFH